jgi:glycosyltransferase involved in cell wall biosynthesis
LVVAAPSPREPSRPQAGHAARRHAVHQFHSGSASGDAITNAMLLTRALLRRQGYTSEIFVEHLEPTLADELRPFAELPAHGDYVLIVRHSMGFEAFDRVAALPAPKVLIYHNITPPELLAHMPALQHFAAVGRDQLALWRPLVEAALADSEYNAIELRRLGFDGAQACTLLFDVAELRARGSAPSIAFRETAFTILFVGRVTASKAQDDLIAAYARFRARFNGPSRLVLVGRHDGPGSAYFDALQALIETEDLAEHVLLTGLVSDKELHAWYGAADLYVSVSRHEGFGVPLVEAMAYGVPVLALPTGAIPYTLGDSGAYLSDAAPETVCAAMLGLANEPALRAALTERQRRSLDRFALARQIPALMQALALAGAAPPPDRAARAALEANLRFTVAGHVNRSYSLAAINRTLALTLEDQRPGAVRLIPVEGSPTDDLSGVPDDVAGAISALAARPRFETGPSVVISQHYPVLIPADRGDVLLALFFWEESRIPAATIAELGAFAAVLAPTRFVAKALIDSGLSIPVRVVGHVPDLAAFGRLPTRRPAPGEKFTFLHVSSGFPRKGVDLLLSAFAKAFGSDDPVRLLIKVFPNPHNDVADQVARCAGAPEIVLIDADLAEADLLDLYRGADAVVLPTRGEGFNIPATEAMAAGIPLIVTGFGGHMDFCTPDNARLLDYRFAPSASHLATPHSLWAEPDEQDLIDALREAVADRAAGAARALAARAAIADLLDRRAFMRRLTDAALAPLLAPPPGQVRIGWVSTWAVRCGIAGYSRHLLEAMPDGADLTLFADTRTDPEEPDPPHMRVERAWRLGDFESVPHLATAIAASDPHVLMIQHQPALLPWTALAELLTNRVLVERIVVVTLHNTLHLMDVDAEERDAALAALGRIARVVVHTVADLNFLKDHGLVATATLLPHGAVSPRIGAPPRALEKTDEIVLGCYGFFLPLKGIGALIEAAALLRRDWPGLRLRLVNADYGTPDSAAEIAACRASAEALGVPVEWRTEFLPADSSLDLLGGCDVVALPYPGSREASSAALRTALGAGGVVAVTPIPLFDEAADAVVRLPGIDAASIADGLGRLFADADLRARTQQAAAIWLRDRAWPDVAARLHGMLVGLVRSGRHP